MKQQTNLTLKQQSIATELATRFQIDAERIYFLNPDKPDEPWLPAESMLTIARQSGNFQTIDESFDQYIEPLKQVIHRATVITKNGSTFTRSGVATLGEHGDVDDHSLAAGRAINAALTAAGFNPLRPGNVIDLNLPFQSAQPSAGDEAQSRIQDLKRIHVIAERKGLIKYKSPGDYDRAAYRQFLEKNFNTMTAAGFDATQRASLINRLEQEPDAVEDEFANVA